MKYLLLEFDPNDIKGEDEPAVMQVKTKKEKLQKGDIKKERLTTTEL